MKSSAERLKWSLRLARQLGLRLTAPRRLILRCLACQKTPVSVDMVAQAKGVSGKCDPATIYRTLNWLAKLGLVRQISLPRLAGRFILAAPAEEGVYIMCNHCGSISSLPDLGPAARKLDRRVMALHGFTAISHEVEFYGICPGCEHAPDVSRSRHSFASK